MSLFLSAALLRVAAEHPELTFAVFVFLLQAVSVTLHKFAPKAAKVFDALMPLSLGAAAKALKQPAPKADEKPEPKQ